MGSFIDKLGELGELIYGAPPGQVRNKRSTQPMDSLLEWILAERNSLIDKRMEALQERFSLHKIVVSEITITPLTDDAQEMVDIYLEMDTEDQITNIRMTLESPPENSPKTKVECNEEFVLKFGELDCTNYETNGKPYNIEIKLKPKLLPKSDIASSSNTTSNIRTSNKTSPSQLSLMTILVDDGKGPPRSVPVTVLPFTIGKNAENGLQLDAAYVSGNHLEIKKENGAFLITDTSTNGTFKQDGTDIGKNAPVDVNSGMTVVLALGRNIPSNEFEANLKSAKKSDFPHLTFRFGTPSPAALKQNGTPKPMPLKN